MMSEEVKQCTNPPLEEEKMNQLFAGLVYVDKKDGMMYTNLRKLGALMDAQYSLYCMIGQRIPSW